MQFEVKVLTTGYWPTFFNFSCRLHPDMVAATQHFEKAYTKKHESRTLTWLHTQGTVVMSAFFDTGRKQLTVSTLQAAVLLAFNARPVMSFKDLRATLSIDEEYADEYTKRVVHPLCCAKKLDIIKKTPKYEACKGVPCAVVVLIVVCGLDVSRSGKITSSDTFTFNANFKHKMKVLTLSSTHVAATPHRPTHSLTIYTPTRFKRRRASTCPCHRWNPRAPRRWSISLGRLPSKLLWCAS